MAPAGGPRRIAVGTTRYAAVAVAQILGGGVLAIYLPRALGPRSYAVFAVAVTFTVWIEITGVTILTAALPKLIVDAGENWTKLARTVLFASLTGLTAVAAVVYAGAGPIARILDDPALIPLIRLFAIDFPLYVTALCVAAIFVGRSLHDHRAALIVTYWLTKPLLTILFVELGLGQVGAVYGSIGASAAMSIAALRLARFGMPAPLMSLRPVLGFTWPIILAYVILRLLHALDMFRVQVAVDNPRAPAYYGIAISLALSLHLLLLSVATAIAPGIASALRDGDRRAARSLTGDAYRFILVVSVGLLAAYLPGRGALIEFGFGAEYASAALPTAILVAAASISALASVAAQGLVAADRPRIVLGAALASLPFDLALLFILVPAGGVTGAAVATAVACTVYGVITIEGVRRHIGAVPAPRTVLRCLVAGGAVVGSGLVLDPEGLPAVGAAVARLIVYVALLRLTGELKKDDLSVVLAAFRPRRRRPPAR